MHILFNVTTIIVHEKDIYERPAGVDICRQSEYIMIQAHVIWEEYCFCDFGPCGGDRKLAVT